MSKIKKFDIGDIVYLITDNNEYKRIITAIIERKYHLEYEVSFMEDNCICCDYEITHNPKEIINEPRE